MDNLCGHFRELLASFGYRSPSLLAVAIDVHHRIKPTGIIDRAGFDERNLRNSSGVREDWRATVRTKISLYRLPTTADVVKRLELSSNGQR